MSYLCVMVNRLYKGVTQCHHKYYGKECSAMDFTDFTQSLKDPLFEKKGEQPQCPEGYKWNKKMGKCEPKVKTPKGENPGDKYNSRLNGDFNIWGATGLNGDGYALEDDGIPSTDAVTAAGMAMSEETFTEMKSDWLSDHKYQKKLADEEQHNREQDNRMKYGKKGAPQDETPLKKGEVRKFNKETGKWESNK